MNEIIETSRLSGRLQFAAGESRNEKRGLFTASFAVVLILGNAKISA
ncbi:MAG TPA: hypothetical protein VLU73_14185 [Methylococcaceae bacterium]|jgi:hypothetical protein|nr:hypothetical protein [Methylococcaceae bacterium]